MNRAIVLVLALLVGTVGFFKIIRKAHGFSRDSVFTSESSQLSSGWQMIDAGTFFVSLPPDWTFRKLQGIDSYVGEISGGGVKLRFDYGKYSNTLAEPSDPSYIVSYESIHGRRAKIVVPKIPGKRMTGVYFDDVAEPLSLSKTALNLVGQNLSSSQQEIAIQILRTLQFKQVRRYEPK